MMIRAANALAEARRVDGLAGHAAATPDWSPVARRIRDEATDTWDDQVAVDRFTGKGGRFVRGTGTITGPDEVTVGDQVFTARKGIVIGTGTSPSIPPIPGLSGTPLWTNREAVETETVPASLAVLGGGAVGVELAQVFARFGARVSVVEALDRLLAGEEPESSALAEESLRRDGVDVRTGAHVSTVDYQDGFTLTLGDGSTVSAEQLLVATGRHTDLAGLGVAALGLDPTARALTVDERMRAGDRVWAIGDVTGHGAFTHVATYQADIAVRDILGQPGPPADYRAVPRVTFLDPEIGAVGLTEQQARDTGLTVHIGTASVAASARGWIHRGEGFLKLIVDADRGVLVGATSAGPVGGEVLSALAVAVYAEVPVERLRHMIFAYPTFHRAIGDALATLP
jgi:pyruvate/2-oxoglutarate dehydrogenase complex dihydrolipoamide dehydrogenase (E3) component